MVRRSLLTGLVVVGAAAARLSSGLADAPPRQMQLLPAGVVYGDAVRSHLTVVGRGDINGDGIADLAVEQTTWRGAAEARAYHVVLGRADWPAGEEVGSLDHACSLGFPQNYRPGPNDTAYAFAAFTDVNGDRVADLIVRVDERVGERIKARSADIYFGRPGWSGIDIAGDAPDLSVRQPRVPTNDPEAARQHMPDRLYPGDYNGDGRQDLAIASCGIPPGSSLAGAIYLYLASENGLGAIDLSRDTPDAIIHGQGDDTLGCEPGEAGTLAADLTGDGATDLLLTTRPPGGSAVAVIVAGRARWPPDSRIADIADVTIVNQAPNARLAAWLVPDMNGDDRLDVVARFDNHSAPSFDCALFSGRRFNATETGGDCDLRFSDLSPAYSFNGDYDGDGHCDFVFAWPRHGCTMADYEWRVLFGPVAPGGEARIGENSGQGDVVFFTPNVDGLPTFARLADHDGDGAPDLALGWLKRRNPDRDAEAGAVAIHSGPVFARAATATPTGGVSATPPLPSPTPSAVGTATARATITASPTSPAPTTPPPTAPSATASAPPTAPSATASALPIAAPTTSTYLPAVADRGG